MRWNACMTFIKELTIFNSVWLGFIMSVLHAFQRHLNIILIHFYWCLLLESVLRFPALFSHVFLETSYMTFIAFELTGCYMMWDLGLKNLRTDYNQSFIFFFVVVVVVVYLCFYVAPSQAFLLAEFVEDNFVLYLLLLFYI